MRKLFLLSFIAFTTTAHAQKNNTPVIADDPAASVNVFLGSAGDHGQMSPAASYPFSMLSIGPQTYPDTHMGYDNRAKLFLGFTHNRFEGVGCQGSGGNLLVKPFMGNAPDSCQLLKAGEQASPGFYSVSFGNGIKVASTVLENMGIDRFQFPTGKKGCYIDFAHAFVGRFKAEEHTVAGNTVSGWIESGTTCSAGAYRMYYFFTLNQAVQWDSAGAHQVIARLNDTAKQLELRIALSSVSVEYAKAAVTGVDFASACKASHATWNKTLQHIRVKGDKEREKLFYSLLYRTVQSPYVVSEKDGKYRAIDGSLQLTDQPVYNGWAIWDNYRTQLPLLSVAYQDNFKNITTSIVNLYRFGKKDYATMHEPSNTVRTEHAIVVLLDAYRKGYAVNWNPIVDSLVKEINKNDYAHPDKALESSYDAWALSQILDTMHKPELSAQYKQKAARYKEYWVKDFQDLSRRDVDQMQARGLYQGTIWQYRWFVPFDNKGLIELAGGEAAYTKQLDTFFGRDYYNHANEPDIQVPLMYNVTFQPWKSQDMVHRFAVDTVVQDYFNDNSRGIGSFIDVIYTNRPRTYIRTMDDDAGAMSAWFVFAGCGFFPACVGWPVYYLHAPLFSSVAIQVQANKTFTVKTENSAPGNRYVKRATLNGQPLLRNWITQQEINEGGTLVIEASPTPGTNWGTQQQWISSLDMK